MKGLSVLLTIVLLVLAQRLAQHLKETGSSPAQSRARSSQQVWRAAAAAAGHVDASNPSLTI